KTDSFQPRDINRDMLLEYVQLPDDDNKASEILDEIFIPIEPKNKEPTISGEGLYSEWQAMPAGADKDAKAKELFGLIKGGKIPTTSEELKGAVDHGSTHLRPPFCRNGNKYPVKDILIKQFPEHKKYVEPFTGSSAIFFNKPKAEQNVLNDLDERMIQSLRWLKSAPPKDDPEWDKIEFKGSFGSGKDQRLSGTRIANARAFFAKVPRSIIEKMAHFKLAGCAGFNGVFANKPSQIYKVSEKPLQRIETYLDLYKEYLKGVSLETKDYANIIKQHDAPDTFFFIDPPYENTSASLGYAEDKGFDFERLRQTLEKVKGKFMVTLNDSPNIRKIFQQFKINGFSAPNPWNTREDKEDRKPRKEITIRNY
ncbi:MAG: DNA adenine methylase, partial [Actinobacteria bacterium]|nr:DNA adenine methylase [Actinomycetota bacterium]